MLVIFLDGVGIGRKDPSANPFFAARLPALRSFFDGEIPSLRHRTISGRSAHCVPLDATLGVEGLPQSGTGQTALFSGVNAAKMIGKHFGPYPYSSLKPIIEQKNIFRLLLESGRSCCFANAFPQRFFDYVRQRPSRLTVTTLSCLHAGIPLLHAEDLEAGRAVSADITNAGWHALGYPRLRTVEPAEAGRRLARLTRQFDFVLYEYWKTDHAGHSRNMHEAIDCLEKLDGLLVGTLEGLDRRDTLLIITSDHGNIEDMTVKTHTRNPVPAVLYGYRRDDMLQQLHSPSASAPDLCHFSPSLLRLVNLRV